MKKLIASLVFLVGTQAFAGANESSFTPTSILKPIRGVSLKSSTAGTTAELYSCAADSESGCLVDVADNAALAALFATPASIAAGTYDEVVIASCKDEGGYSAQIKGSVDLGGTTYYTKTVATTGGDPLGTTSPAEYVSVSFTGCSYTVKIPGGATVAVGGSLDVSLFLSVTNIAWARLAGASIPSGCIANTGDTKSVCLAYPDVAPYVGSVTPTLQKFHICEGSTSCAENTSNGQMLLLFDAADAMIGGFTRRYFSQNSTSGGNYDTALRIFTKNSDGTYDLQNYGSSATTSYLQFPAFERATHGGTLTNTTNSTTTDYKAWLQP